MANGPSPLVGYNTNVRHHGKLYHIQTEDSGVSRPHIITHLFADGGRIVATAKTQYAEHVGRGDLKDVVKGLMKEQHKGMFIALRDGIYDEPEESTEGAVEQSEVSEQDRAAEQFAGESSGAETPRRIASTAPGRLYQAPQPASASAGTSSERPSAPSSIFGGELLSEKSLDEVILSYLAEDE